MNEYFNNKNKQIVKIIFLVLVVLILIITIAWLYSSWQDSNSIKGPYSGKSQEQIVADLNAQIEEGEMNVSIANTIRFPNGSQNEGYANIENIAANHLDQKVTIYLEDSNEILYESGAISPNYHIDKIKLKKYLEPGNYKAFALVSGFEHEEQGSIESFFNNLFNKHKKVGSIGAQINLLVES